MGISENIKRIREEKGISQSKFAELIGMERTNYFRLEKRGNKLTIEQLEKIADALGVTVIELLTGEAQKAQDSEREKELEAEVKELRKDKKTLYELLDFYREFKEVADFYKEYKNIDSQDKEKAQQFLKESLSKKAPKGYEPTLSDTLKFFIALHYLEDSK